MSPIYFEKERFVYPKPAKKKEKHLEQIIIKYTMSRKEFDFASDYFEIDNPDEIGRKIFNYFFERENDE
jgi:hypothetical protein